MSSFKVENGLTYNKDDKMDRQLVIYTDDIKFVRWVLHPTEELDHYWRSYIKKNPDKANEISRAREVIQILNLKEDDVLSQLEIDSLFQKIEKGIAAQKGKKIYMNFLRYAAAIIILASVGTGYYLFNKKSGFKQNALIAVDQSIDNIYNTELVLANNQVVQFKQDEVFIEQLNDQTFILNQNDTVVFKNLNQLNKLIVPTGKLAQLRMIDGTVVYMNAGSQLAFPVTFDPNQRQAVLSGEAFFEVTHNPEQPFVVVTNSINIEVLGTKFNVAAYPSETQIETYLVEGKVKVSENNTFFSKSQEYLNPLQSAVYEKSGVNGIQVNNINDIDYITWYKGYISFKSAKLSSIINKIERHYGVQIQLNDSSLEEKTISGKLKIKNEPVETVIQILANTASLEKEQKSNNTFILK